MVPVVNSLITRSANLPPEKTAKGKANTLLNTLRSSVVSLLLLPALSAALHSADEPYSPIISAGELAFEYNGTRTFDRDPAKNGIAGHEFGAEYGVNERFQIGASAEWERTPDDGVEFEGYEFKAKVLFTEPGAYPFEIGGLIEYHLAAERDEHPDKVEGKLLFQFDSFQDFTTLINVTIEREVGPLGDSSPEFAGLIASRYRWTRWFQPGLEYQAEIGHRDQFKHTDEQEHYLGVAAQGRLPWRVTTTSYITWQAAWYVGVTEAAADSAVRAQLEYEIYF